MPHFQRYYGPGLTMRVKRQIIAAREFLVHTWARDLHQMLQAGLMMDRQLLISDVIVHGAGQFGTTRIVSREAHGALFRYNYAACKTRAQQFANALEDL